jgi:hypothetical protein
MWTWSPAGKPGVAAAAGPVEAALREGFAAVRQDRTSELAGLFPGLGDELADGTSPHLTADALSCSWPTLTAVMTRC